mgnify:CR=1 FL=1
MKKNMAATNHDGTPKKRHQADDGMQAHQMAMPWPEDATVWFVCAEAAPYAKVGGLGDVSGELPRALAAAGIPVCLCMPLHGGVSVPESAAYTPLPDVPAWIGHAGVHAWDDGALRVQMYELPRWFGRDRVYSWPDDNERFAAFCLAVARHVGRSARPPRVLHLNDWHTASLAILVASARDAADTASSPLASVRTLLTLHSLQYQGWSGMPLLYLLDSEGRATQEDRLLDPHRFNALRSGILHADAVNTVSPTHAREILRQGEGFGLETLLAHRAKTLPKGLYCGILNRIGNAWDPERDAALPRRFSARTLAARNINRTALRKEMGFAESGNPLAAYVGRLADGKGIHLLADAAEEWLADGMQLVVLGIGEPLLADRMSALAARWPERMVFRPCFDPALARRIYGGADLFLMPSEREACGLSQQIAMRYGCVPVVRCTGGLADTVREGENGFVFHKPVPSALDRAVRRAWNLFRDRSAWRGLMRAAMDSVADWRESAREYADLYHELLSQKGDACMRPHR